MHSSVSFLSWSLAGVLDSTNHQPRPLHSHIHRTLLAGQALYLIARKTPYLHLHLDRDTWPEQLFDLACSICLFGSETACCSKDFAFTSMPSFGA